MHIAGATPTIISVARDQAAPVEPMHVIFGDEGFVEVWSAVSVS